jgi:hypothetical protein
MICTKVKTDLNLAERLKLTGPLIMDYDFRVSITRTVPDTHCGHVTDSSLLGWTHALAVRPWHLTYTGFLLYPVALLHLLKTSCQEAWGVLPYKNLFAPQ